MSGVSKNPKERADKLMVAQGLVSSREKAQGLILSGAVYLHDQQIQKAGQLIAIDSELNVRATGLPFVSRGGLKLAKALQTFQIKPTDYKCLDIGASTGGFTDCLLKNGASSVWAVDVGYGQLAWTLRQDERVFNLERTNFRYLDPGDMAESFDLAVCDVSFISLKHIFQRLPLFLRPHASFIALVKPQFEAGRDAVGKNGVVKDPKTHVAVLERVRIFGTEAGFRLQALDWSPIKGPKGNIEFLSYWRFDDQAELREFDFNDLVAKAHVSLANNEEQE